MNKTLNGNPKKTCKNCEDTIYEHAHFCWNCGTAQQQHKVTKFPEKSSLVQLPQMKEINLSPELCRLFLQKKPRRTSQKALIACIAYWLLQQQKQFELKCVPMLPFEPRDYQVETAMSVLEDRDGSAILADEVGLGKTIEAGLVLKELSIRNIVKKVIIIVPANLLEQWAIELHDKFGLKFSIIQELPSILPDFIIISHHRAKRSEYADMLRNNFWDLVIIDEAHILRNSNTIFYKFSQSLPKRYLLLLTATPLQNNLHELFNLIVLVKPGFFKSKRWFSRQYMKDKFTARNPEQLKDACTQVIIRHRRQDTFVESSLRHVSNIAIELTDEERHFYDLVLTFTRTVFSEHILEQEPLRLDHFDHVRLILLLNLLLKESTSSHFTVIKTMHKAIRPRLEFDDHKHLIDKIIDAGRNIGASSKMKALLHILSQKQDTQWIVYSEYLATIQQIEHFLSLAGYRAYTYTGNSSHKQKKEILAQFENDSNSILLSTEIGGQGLNLQFCNNMINFDLPWNPMRIEQRIGRIHRFGQSKSVYVYNIVAQKTFEEYLVDLLTTKIKLFEKVVGEIDSILAYVQDTTPIELRIGISILQNRAHKNVKKELLALTEEIEKAAKQLHYDTEQTATLFDFPKRLQ